MKAHLTKVSLALLSAAFLLGCQEQGSEPVGPEGLEIQAKRESRKGKGDGSSTLAELIISGGMTSPADQLVAFFDGKNQFRIQAHDNTIGDRIKLAMHLTGCGTGDLLGKLTDGVTLERRQLFITVGKDGIVSDDHKIGVTWDDGDSSFRMGLRPNTVSTVPVEGDALPLTFTFTGGTVKLTDLTERRHKDRIKVTCTLDPGLEIVMVLTLAPTS